MMVLSLLLKSARISLCSRSISVADFTSSLPLIDRTIRAVDGVEEARHLGSLPDVISLDLGELEMAAVDVIDESANGQRRRLQRDSGHCPL